MSQEAEQKVKKCPFCAEEILTNAVKCKHCGEWLNKQTAGSVSLSQSTIKHYSNVQPVWHFVLLSIVTFGIYEFYWFYRNWKHFKAHKNLNISPGWRTVGLFVPIYGLIIAYRQLRNIRDFSKQVGVVKTYSPGLILFGWFALNALWKLPDPFWLLTLLSVWPLAIVQNVLNSYWEKEQHGLSARTSFTGGQIILLILGGVFLTLGLIGIFIPE